MNEGDMGGPGQPVDEARVLQALATVRDPELDESITELGFVERLHIEGTAVRVWLRLPTYWCAPNFAYLMAADAKKALESVVGVEETKVELIDHFVSTELNEGLAERRDFAQTFPGDTAGSDLGGLRDLFRRKGFIARQERLARSLTSAGVGDLHSLTIGDLPAGPETALYLERRAELGIDISGGAPFLVAPDGRPIPDSEVRDHLRFARTVAVSIEANAGLCRGLLDQRYGKRRIEEAAT
jgi:metal-sulfur cluster biosynthetic enzyme